jgi:cytoskeletal protein CcmA (bactofilin family)
MVELKATAIIDGDVITQDLAVARGASVSGNIKVNQNDSKETKPKKETFEKKVEVKEEKGVEETTEKVNLDKDLVD